MTRGDHAPTLAQQRKSRKGMTCKAINIAEKLGLLDAPWQPRMVAEMSDYQFKLVGARTAESDRWI